MSERELLKRALEAIEEIHTDKCSAWCGYRELRQQIREHLERPPLDAGTIEQCAQVCDERAIMFQTTADAVPEIKPWMLYGKAEALREAAKFIRALLHAQSGQDNAQSGNSADATQGRDGKEP